MKFPLGMEAEQRGLIPPGLWGAQRAPCGMAVHMQRRQDKSQPRSDAMLLLLEPSSGLGADLRGKAPHRPCHGNVLKASSPRRKHLPSRVCVLGAGEKAGLKEGKTMQQQRGFFQLSLSTLTNGLDLVTLVSSQRSAKENSHSVAARRF